VSLPNDPIILGYGSVRWGVACETLAMSVRPVLDAAGRSVKWLQYDFTLKFVIGEENQAVGLTTDLDMATLRAELSRVGLELHYLNVGYGALQSVPAEEENTFGLPTNSRDVLWGPRPQILQYKPMGTQSAECVWSCQVCLAPCPEDALYEQGLLEWCWKVSFAIDRSGYTTRTTSGFVRVVGHRAGAESRQIADHADRLRERVEPQVPTGFRRESRSFQLSEDKARMDYSFTDTEEPPNAPPPRCVQVSASHILNMDSIYSVQWRGTLTATYEVARDAPRGAAEGMFARLINERVRSRDGVPYLKPRTNFPTKTQIIFRGYEASEPEIYGKQTAAFRLEYSFQVSLESLVAATGLWTPIKQAGGDWARWSASMQPRAWHVRGNARMAFDAEDDAIIDICEDVQPDRNMRAATPPRPDVRTPVGRLENPTPSPSVSWLFWISLLRIEVTDETIELKPLPPLEPLPDRIGMPRGGPYRLRTNPGGGPYSLRTDPGSEPISGRKSGVRADQVPPTAGTPKSVGVSPGQASGPSSPPGAPIIQQRASSTTHAILSGYAIRAGHPVIPPSLREVGGVKAVPCNRADKGDGVDSGIVGVWFGLPIHYCRWQIRYILAGRPTGDIPTMDNPFM
jgi:NAD-dependent dihydropyrimidine dehydrogenase PreA subunit